MDRDELLLWKSIELALEDYGLDYILEDNDVTLTDIVLFLVQNYGLRLPNEHDEGQSEALEEEGF